WEIGQCFYLGGNPWNYASPGPDLTGEGDWTDTTYNTGSVWLADGTRLNGGGVSGAPPVPPDLNTLVGYGAFSDTNGNLKGEYAGGLDTLGRNLVTQQNGTNYIQYQINDSSGTG